MEDRADLVDLCAFTGDRQCPGGRKVAWFRVVADIGPVAGTPDAGGVIEFLRDG